VVLFQGKGVFPGEPKVVAFPAGFSLKRERPVNNPTGTGVTNAEQIAQHFLGGILP
jgi:hypothetical protein